jgi:hypothetical protein
MRYVATVISLDGKPVIRVRTVTGLAVGYFTSPSDIHDHGIPVDPADIEVLP